MVDPTVLGIGGKGDALSLRVGRHHLAIVAAGHDAACVGGGGEDGAAVDRDAACVARTGYEEERLLAEHENCGLPEEMRGHHGGLCVERPHALDDGRDVGAGIGHACAPLSS